LAGSFWATEHAEKKEIIIARLMNFILFIKAIV
jgi:hypothetical protein